MGFVHHLAVVSMLWIAVSPLVAEDSRFPDELTRFREAEGNPVFTAGDDDDWDARIRERGWILREGGQWKLWYTGYDGTRASLKQLGYATSPDGVHWTRDEDNPIYDDHWVEDMMVFRGREQSLSQDGEPLAREQLTQHSASRSQHDGTYYMFAEGFRDQAHLLTSTDGIDWTRVGPLDVRQEDGTPIEAGPYGTPTVWLEDGVWHLFYERRDAGVWLATSDNLEVWTNVQDEPVLSPGPGEYDRDFIAMNQIIRHDGRYYAYYHGASAEHDPRLWTTNVAVSDDLLDWTKYPGNPLFPPEENKSSGILVHDGERYRLYTMHDEVRMHVQE